MSEVHELLLFNEGFVVNQACRFRKFYENADLDDLIQEGRLGIIDAAKRFKPQVARVTSCPHRQFMGHARHYIMRRMLIWCREKTMCVRIPYGTNSARRIKVHSDHLDAFNEYADGPSPSQPVELVVHEIARERADWEILRNYVGRLPKYYREAIRAVYLECHTEKDVASELGLSRGVFRARLSYALLSLRRMMHDSNMKLVCSADN